MSPAAQTLNNHFTLPLLLSKCLFEPQTGEVRFVPQASEKKARKVLLCGYDPRGTVDPRGGSVSKKAEKCWIGKVRKELASKGQEGALKSILGEGDLTLGGEHTVQYTDDV